MLDPTKNKELQADIAALEVGALTVQSYEKLAVLKTVKFFQDLEEMGGLTRFLSMADQAERPRVDSPASYSAAPIETTSTSDFLLAINGKDPDAVWAIMDDLMDTLRSVNGKAYNSVMRRIREI